MTLFFVMSGFLITTLLLREEAETGRVSLRAFLVRRAFRIFPLYYLALAVFGVLAVGFGLGATAGSFLPNLALYATYNGEFGSGGLFSHSWSLGVEEKFYLLWPVLAFGIPLLRRRRTTLAVVAVLVTVLCGFLPALGYLAVYAPIMRGCVLGVLMHSPRTFALVEPLGRPVPATVAVAALAAGILLDSSDGLVHTGVGLLAALALPAFVLGPYRLRRRVLLSPALRYVGTRSYAVYLFHPLVKNATGRLLAEGTDDVLLQCLRLGDHPRRLPRRRRGRAPARGEAHDPGRQTPCGHVRPPPGGRVGAASAERGPA